MERLARPTRPRRRNGERGMSMVVVLLILMFLLALGLAAVWYASLQLGAARSLNSRQMAVNAARAGVEHARAILAQPSSWTGCLGSHGNALDAIPSAANRTAVGAILYATTDCASFTTPLRSYPFTAASGDAGYQSLGSYTVWVRNDPLDINAGSFTNDTNSSVIVRVVGTDPSGTSQAILEAAVVRSTGPGVNLDNFVWGKNIDTSNSNSATAAVRFQ